MNNKIVIPPEVLLMLSDKEQEYKLRHRYGLDNDQYNYLLFKQEFKCKVCTIDMQEYGKTFHVDHCHATGVVRGLLCSNCNTALGLLKDDISILANAIIYLKTTEC